MKKVLIVDDEPNILLSLEFLMKKQGYDVFIARDGGEAIEIINKDIPNLIILDIMMPKVDGYEVCRFVKTRYKTTKVVFLSAKTQDEAISRGFEIGADMYIKKPFSTRNIVKQVKELLV